MTKKQIIIVQMAARGAGLRSKAGDKRYRLLLAQYKQSPSGKPVTSCKQLNNSQVTDFLAVGLLRPRWIESQLLDDWRRIIE